MIKKQPKTIYVIVALLVLSLFAGCGLFRGEQPVAQVNDAKLTQADLYLMIAKIGTEEEYLNAQRKFVNDWIDRELLFQEAVRQNMKPTAFMEVELERVRKSMMVNMFLNFQIDSIISVSDFEIRDYYEDNPLSFIAETNFFRFSAIKTSDADFARVLDRELKNGSDIETIFSGSPDKCKIVSKGMDYLPQTLIFPALETELQKIKNNREFTRLNINGEIFFVKVEEVLLKGEKKHFSTVAQEIKQILLYKRRQEKYNNLISRLRKNYPYEINLKSRTDPPVSR